MKHELEVVNIRLVKEPSLYSEEKIVTPDIAIKVMAKELAQYDREVMLVLNLKTNGQVINMNVASIGTINSSLISAREIFKSSILSNAASIILMHNHPSGSVIPSLDDREATKKLVECGMLLDIPIQDHIIVAAATAERFSFYEAGLLDTFSKQRHRTKIR